MMKKSHVERPLELSAPLQNPERRIYFQNIRWYTIGILDFENPITTGFIGEIIQSLRPKKQVFDLLFLLLFIW